MEIDLIQYKDNSVLRGILAYAWHNNLIEVYLWLKDRYPDQIFLTCAYEDRDYPSTHSVDPLRAFDIRSWVFTDPQAVTDNINQHWKYDPDRMDMNVAVYHDVGRGKHIHLQVHDNTMEVL